MSIKSLLPSDTPQVVRSGTGSCVMNFLSQVALKILTYLHLPTNLITSDTICSELDSCESVSIVIGRHQLTIPYCLYDVILGMREGEVRLIPLSFCEKLSCLQLKTAQPTHSYTAVQLISFKRYEALHKMSPSGLLEEARRQKSIGNEFFRALVRGNAAYHYSMSVRLCVLSDSQEQSALQLKKLSILNLSACWLQFSSFERAIATTQQVINLEPGNEKALFRQAVALRQLQELERAMNIINKVLELNPCNSEAIQELNIIRIKQKENSKKELEKYSKLFS